MRVYRFFKDWSLPITMLTGVLAYMIYVRVPLPVAFRAAVPDVIAVIQPTLIFLMLFISFCKVRVTDLRVKRWHLWLLAFQLFALVILSSLLVFSPSMPHEWSVLVEAAILCLICPTATAAAVITAKLGGSASSLISYTMLVNLAVAVAVPCSLTFIRTAGGGSFMESFMLISGKVFPLLLCPLAFAEILRYMFPSLHALIVERGRNWPFYLWLVALALAIAVTTRAIAHTTLPLSVLLGIAAVSFICCIVQFAVGRYVGARYGEMVTGGQALGQKNTVFAIWLAYTFMTPVTAIAGGFYSIWHNIVNTYQLYRHNHKNNG